MADFFDSIRDNLENHPEPEFNPADWDDMKNRIQGQSRRPLPLFWWSTAALVLLLLGSNAWWYTRSFPEGEPVMIAGEVTYVYDTIVKKEIIYQTDTLIQYRNRPATARTASNFATTQKALAFQREILAGEYRIKKSKRFFDQTYAADKLLHRTADALRSEQFNSASVPENLLTILQENKLEEREFLNFLPTGLKLIENNNIVISENLNPSPSVAKEHYRRRLLLETWRNIQPTGVIFGAEGGYVFPVGVGSEDRSGYTGGIKAGLTFSPALRMILAGNFQHLQYQSDDMGDEFGVPVISPPTDDLVFQQADVSQASLQLAVSLQYLFRAQKDFRPYVGVGFGAHSLLPAEIKYTFINPDDLELIAEYDVERQGWEAGDIHLQTGFEFRLSEYWHLPVGVNYIFNPEADTPRALQLKAGINYHF